MKQRRARDKTADAILVADLHITDSVPVSRTDDYMMAQQTKLRFLADLSRENNNCPILCAGDVFDHWRASPWLCSWAYQHLPYLITIPGNHDLPAHSLQRYDQSALALLDRIGRASVLRGNSITINDGNTTIEITGVPFGLLGEFVPAPSTRSKKKKRILLLHELVWPAKKPPWAGHSYTGREILRHFGDDFDLIISGDNHQSFVVSYKESILVNPGSMMRSVADQKGSSPKCYLYYADTHEVDAVKFPIERDVHNTEHLQKQKDRDGRIRACIERMGDWKGGLSFRDNLRAFFKGNKTPRKVRELIWASLDEETT